MKQKQGRLGRRRVAVLIVGLMSVLTMPMPAQAGLGDLIDGLLAPVNEVPIVGDVVEPTVQGVVDPQVGDVLNPIAGAVVDPIVDQVIAPVENPVVTPVVTPIVEAVVGEVPPPVVEEVPPPVQETTQILPIGSSPRESTGVESRPAGVSLSLDVAPPWYSAPVATPPVPTSRTTRTLGLEAAVSVQAALIASAPLISHSDARGVPDRMVGDSWLDGLIGWLRDSADGLATLLALPVRLLALLARALLTAGSGLIAPLSMLLALTAYLVKDRRWTRTSLTAAR